MGGGMGGMGGASTTGTTGTAATTATTAPTADTRTSREKYANELAQIKEMGFNDEDTILQILEQTGGNVNLAIERLFSSLGQ